MKGLLRSECGWFLDCLFHPSGPTAFGERGDCGLDHIVRGDKVQ